MSFKELQNIKMEYRTLSDDVVDSFYIPCLKQASIYKRAVGFFSSSILLQISKGLCAMEANKAKIKLLISPKLDKNDYEAIVNGYNNQPQDFINNKFNELFEDVYNEESINRFALLSHLISIGLLDIRVVILKENNDRAMYHEKMGIMQDNDDNVIAFSGSANETENGYNLNYEAIDVYCSWKSEDAEQRAGLKDLAFNRLWNGTENGTIVLKFPEIIVNKLMVYQSKSTGDIFKLDEQFQEKLKKLKKVNHGPKVKDGIKLFDYQQLAIDTWESKNFKGIYDMATGTGKTFAGGGSICRLFEIKKRLFAVIVCPYVHLVEQWYEELKIFNIDAIKCYGNKNKYSTDLKRASIKFKQKRTNFVCILTTNKTFINDRIQDVIVENLEDTLLLVDEAHNFGADKISSYLTLDYPYRLALSATLERYGDEEGTNKLFNFFGEKCITYSLKRAIQEDKLTKYKYYPILVELDEDELGQYVELTKKIKQFKYKSDENMKRIPDALKKLLLRRARIIAGAKNKINKLIEIITPYKDMSNILVYCGAVKYGEDGYEDSLEEKKQIRLVIEKLKKELGMIVSKFTSEEDSEEREALKTAFKNEEIQALVAIKCLDEGMNIPAIKTAFILASSTNPKEYIQRRGRVLRKFPGKQYAEIYDFITISRPLDELNRLSKEDKELEISLANKELTRLIDFANLSDNPQHSNKIIDDIRKAYSIDIIGEGGVDSYE